jgi:FAD/FMN-containing dehydrogenase
MESKTESTQTFQTLENFGHSLSAPSIVITPKTVDEIYQGVKFAKKNGYQIAARGAGRSYNDAALNGGGVVMLFTEMNNITSWDPETGLITCEPGVTLEQLWHKILPDGWWPPVVSGTMTTTLGGCLGMNIHGKNNYRMGTFGEHVVEFTALLPNGAELTCSPNLNGDLFYSMISGMGMLGFFTSITMKMKKVDSGYITVNAFPVHNLDEHLTAIERDAPTHDYTVGWLDTMVGGKALGRGQIHAANYVHGNEDPNPSSSMKLESQILPEKMFGVFPKSLIHYFMKPFSNNLGWKLVSTAKYVASLRTGKYNQSHAAFHFLLDYVPNWEKAYGRGGLIQYQSFLPKETARETWTKLIDLSLSYHLPSYLGVTKRHRPDKFLLTHAVDGFSLAMDFKVTSANQKKLSQMLQEFDKMVLEAGGRFYFAKNSETSRQTTEQFLGAETIERFKALKRRTDPDMVLESDLYKRLFA